PPLAKPRSVRGSYRGAKEPAARHAQTAYSARKASLRARLLPRREGTGGAPRPNRLLRSQSLAPCAALTAARRNRRRATPKPLTPLAKPRSVRGSYRGAKEPAARHAQTAYSARKASLRARLLPRREGTGGAPRPNRLL